MEMPVRRISPFVVIGLFCGLSAWGDGRVEGQVAGDDGGYLEGALVRLPELKLEAVTSADGSYAISGIPAGSYEVTVSYIGYPPRSARIDVRDGETTRQAFAFSELIEEVVVYGEQTASTASALNQQRAADGIVSVVSATDIGQFPDQNVSEALARVSGVFLERDQGEGRFVGIRGIDPNLIVTTINGVNVPAPENDRRSVALDVIPSELLSALEVSKSITPDMDADGIGGAVNIKSASAFDSPGRNLTVAAQTSFNDLQDESSPRASLIFSDTFDLGDHADSLGVAAAVSWFDRNFGSENIETDGGWFGDLERTDDVEFKGAEEIEQRDYVINRERLGLAANFDYRPSGNASWYVRTLFSSFSDQEYRTRNEFKFDKGDAVEGGDGFATWSDATLEKELKDRYEAQEILSISAGGTQAFDAWTLNYRVGYSTADESEPNRRDTEFKIKKVRIGYSNHGERPGLFADPATLDADGYELSEIVIEDNATEDVERSFKIDLRRDFDAEKLHGYLEVGTKLRRREKSNDIGIRVFDGFPGDPTLADFSLGGVDYVQGAFGLGVSEDAIDRYIAANLSGFELNDKDTLAASTGGDYQMDENVDALFVKNRLDFDKLRVVYGLRYERTAFDAAGLRVIYDDVGADGDPAPTPVSFSDNYASVLPSANLRYAVNDNLLIRAAFYQTMARPKFGDLAPGGEVEFEEDDGETVLKAEIGNPGLDPLQARNFDLSIEYYRQDVGLLSASLYYKTLEDFVVLADTATITDFTQFVGGSRVDKAEVIQPVNGDDANVLGVELAWVQHLSSLPGLLSNLLVSANATFTDGEATLPFREEKIAMPRQADRVLNFALGYETDRFSSRLAFSHKSERLLGLEELDDPAFDVFQDAHTQLDLGMKYYVNGKWELTLDANNLTDEPYYAYFGDRRYNAQYEIYGRTIAIGVRYQH
ncbi:MAG: TonB-dependent receptor [Gammaproteobacteria bacterium]|nr:TonB-dependent receptor [Gammaproteobacteria bacterium]